MAATSNKELLRVLNLKDAVGIGLGAIIGAGIFVVTGVAAGVSSPAFVAGLIIAGIIATFNGLSSAQHEQIFSKAIPVSGLLGCIAMSFSLPMKVIFYRFCFAHSGVYIEVLFHRAGKETEIKPSNDVEPGDSVDLRRK